VSDNKKSYQVVCSLDKSAVALFLNSVFGADTYKLAQMNARGRNLIAQSTGLKARYLVMVYKPERKVR